MEFEQDSLLHESCQEEKDVFREKNGEGKKDCQPLETKARNAG